MPSIPDGALFNPASLPHTSPRRGGVRATLVSTLLHAALLATLAVNFHHTARIIPYRLPGTAQGMRYLTFYSAGSSSPTHGAVALKKSEPRTAKPSHAAPTAPQPTAPQPPTTEAGTAASQLSGIGQGNVSIALQKVFPYPKPDLSSLPHGTHGDVILDAVIDQQGNIAQLTLVQGLGPAIDNVVIATVRQWSYTPALRNGAPVASEQELHFHYERT